MNRTALIQLIRAKRSFLCVGLDTDPVKLPDSLKSHPDGVYEFNKAIIAATLPYAVSYKLNIAFYEALGPAGWDILERTLALIPKDEAFVIADAKRGDIGNTADQYARAFFDRMKCHSVTVNPYMGSDSVTPFLARPGHWAIVLGLTSNSGAADIELLQFEDGSFVFEHAMSKIASLGSDENLMFVVGATKPEFFSRIRKIAPSHFLLIPGVGAQGGTLESLKPLLTDDIAVLVNSSRQIIFASIGADFAEAAAYQSRLLQTQMNAMMPS